MRVLFTLAILIAFSNSILAKTKEIDSLKFRIQKTPKSIEKCELLQDLGYQYESVNLDSAIAIYKKAIKMAQEIKSYDEIGDARLNLAFAHSSKNNKQAVLHTIRKAIESYSRVDSIGDLSNAYFNLGTFYQNFNMLDSAEDAYQKGITYAIKDNKNERAAAIYNNLGLIYSSTGRINSAIKMQSKALAIRDSLSLPIIPSYVNLATLYSDQQLYNKALFYNRKAYRLLDSTATSYTLNGVTEELAKSFMRLNKVDSAQLMYFSILETIEDSFKTNAIKARINEIKELPLRARKYYEIAASYYDTTEYSPEFIQFYNGYAQLLFNGFKSGVFVLAEIKEAISFSTQSLRMAKKLGLSKEIENQYNLLYELYEAAGDADKALLYSKRYIDIRKSNEKEKSQQSLADAQTRFELGKKKLKINLLKAQAETAALKKLEAEQKSNFQDKITIAISVVLAISLILILIIFKQSKDKSSANKKLEAQNEERALLLREIHHRVKNNLQVISSLLELQAKKVSNSESELFKEGQSRVRAMALIHEELYQNKNLAQLDFKAYTAKLSRQIQSLFIGKENVTISINGPILKLDIDTAIPLGLILNELVTNAFKYGLSENGSLIIEFEETEMGNYKVAVKDSGEGLPPEYDIKKSKSLGLRLVNRLAKQLYGKATYSNNERPTFEISFKDTLERKKIA